MRGPRPGATTNIGTTVPPRTPGATEPLRFQVSGGKVLLPGIPEALPIARVEGEGPGARVIAADPLWIPRWQNSKTIKGERPWVKAYRYWYADVAYESWGPNQGYRIDFMWKTAQWGYPVGRALFFRFRDLTSSVGEFWWDHIAGRGWSRGKPTRIQGFPVSR